MKMNALVQFFMMLRPAIVLAAAFLPFVIAPAAAQDAAAIERGKYIYTAAGCEGCHTDAKNKGEKLAGGRALVTPFGTYYGPNITPDKTHGIGNWTDAQFIRALREGVSPSGEHYFPVFPYTSFSKLTDRDMLDLKAYIFAQPAVARADTPHDIKFPFGFRFTMIGWKMLFLDKGPLQPDPSHDAQWNRGAYLVRAAAHCGECHTERNILGAVRKDRELGGSPTGPEGRSVPNITPHEKTHIGQWSADEIAEVLSSGLTPEGDSVSNGMDEVVANTGKLTEDDRMAIAVFLKSLPPAPPPSKN
jgi:mono/diheme cytochrome c family protein